MVWGGTGAEVLHPTGRLSPLGESARDRVTDTNIFLLAALAGRPNKVVEDALVCSSECMPEPLSIMRRDPYSTCVEVIKALYVCR